jgi:hypothetical protein
VTLHFHLFSSKRKVEIGVEVVSLHTIITPEEDERRDAGTQTPFPHLIPNFASLRQIIFHATRISPPLVQPASLYESSFLWYGF